MSRLVEWRGNFTSIVLLVDGLIHREAKHLLKQPTWLTNGKSPTCIPKRLDMLGPN